ncbi:hypothetical protein ABT275_45610 [Streptomyces sp. NPDC001185]|uniref:hypothetical protein n=1 Tax=Streptomyces sp. NPDC001185 TaxID=3154380 RepID=UPI00332EFD7D
MITATIPAVVALALADIGGDKKPTSASSPCHFPAVQITAPDNVGSTFQITAKLNCPPPSGTKYLQIAQLDNFGDPGTEHTVYCPLNPITPGQEKRTYTTTRDIHASELHSKRAIYT